MKRLEALREKSITRRDAHWVIECISVLLITLLCEPLVKLKVTSALRNSR